MTAKVAKNSNRGSKPGERRGGRKKGTPNKATQAVQEKLQAMDCDPIEGMAEIAQEAMKEQNYMLAGQMFKELAKYYAPTMKSIEFKGEMDTKNVSNIMVDIEVHDVTTPS